MEKIAVCIAPVLLGVLLLKLITKPIKWVLKLAVHGAIGIGCLHLVNLLPGFGIPLNAVTAITAGFGGLPGVALLAALEFLP